MCGRYEYRKIKKQDIVDHWSGVSGMDHELLATPRYNVAPTQSCPVMVEDRDGFAIRSMRWGFRMATRLLVNGRIETASQLSAFAGPWRGSRCLVFAHGYYEWRTDGKLKLPNHIARPDHSLLPFAGLWRKEAGQESESAFTILTCPAGEATRHLHDRQPVILEDVDVAQWLQPSFGGSSLDQWLGDVVLPRNTALDLKIDAVTPRMNSPKFESPECLVPIQDDWLL